MADTPDSGEQAPLPEGYQEVVAVVRRHGAWLISLYLNDVTQDFGHHEMSDCAGSLAVAKRVAREIASEWSDGARWVERSPQEWVLNARLHDFSEAY